jgi:hypothetical protein
MSKSSDFDFIGLYTALLIDIAVYFPNDQVEWDRDLSRLSQLQSSRGLPVFTIDLPNLGKILDLSLSKGRLDLNGENLSGSRHPGSKIPRLFWGLWTRLFDDDGYLKHDIDPNVVFFLRTLLYVGKNLRMDCPEKYLYDTIKDFYNVDETLPPAPEIWDQDGSDIDISSCGQLADYNPIFGIIATVSGTSRPICKGSMLNAIQRCCDYIAGDIGSFDSEALRFRHGPGAVSDLSGGSYKYSFPNWNPRLERQFPYDSCGSTPLEWMGTLTSKGIDMKFEEPHSRLIAVPKTQKGPRLIAAEPTCNQWIQQGLRDFLTTRLKSKTNPLNNCVDFSNQQFSRDMVLKASRTGNLATVDLSSASDRLSCAVIQRVFRRNKPLLEAFIASRTRYITNEIDQKSPGLHKLRKFSTQGSALTFPVQSIVFAAICIGVGKYLHPYMSYDRLSRQIRVYGDDIIVPVSWEPQLREALHLLGLRVNINKTHVTGKFRESCGMDGYMGYDVTPPYIRRVADKSNAEAVASVVATANNFFMKGLWHTAKLIDKTTATANLAVVGHGSGVFGLKSFTGAPEPTKTRWNKDYHVYETKVLTIMAKSLVLSQDTAACLLQFFTERGYLLSKDSQGTLNGKLWSLLNPLMDYESGVAVAGVPVIRNTWVPTAELS